MIFILLWWSDQQASYSVVCACVVMLRIKTEDQWHDREDHLPQKGLTRWQEAILCILSMAFLGFLVGLCYRTGAPVAYGIAFLAMMGLLTIPLLARQVCGSHHFVGVNSFFKVLQMLKKLLKFYSFFVI